MKDKVKTHSWLNQIKGKKITLQMIILITKEMIPAILFFAVKVVFTVSIQLA